jgi:DNA-binding response OmpR family regulator
MKQDHTALIVEDDLATSEDLVEIVGSIDAIGVVVNNSEEALLRLERQSFCFVLLDLQIKHTADSIKGNVEYGKALLRKIRQKHGEHNGIPFWLPVLVLSGHAREADAAVEVMKDGASDVIQKPLNSQYLSKCIREALKASGRESHNSCQEPAPQKRPDLSEGVVVAIPGDRLGRRTRITVASMPVDLTDGALKVLLHLMVAHRNDTLVHKADMGATEDQGFKGISRLRDQLKAALRDVNIIKNHYHGNYSFREGVAIGECEIDKLVEIGDAKIAELARRLKPPPDADAEKV